MAGFAKLNARRARLWLLLAGVLLLHALVLDGLAGRVLSPILLQPMRTPVFTRLLAPQAAPVPPPAPAPRAEPPDAGARASFRPQASVPRQATPTEAVTPPAPPAIADTPLAPAPPEPQVAQPAPEPAPTAQAQAGAATPEAAVASAAPAPPPAVQASGPAQAALAGPLDGWPVDTRLSYRVGGLYRGGELHGRAQVQWQRDGSRYQNRIEIDLLLAALVLTSQGEATAHGLMPQVYQETRGGRPARGVRIGESEVMFADGRIVRRPAGLQDTASQFVELSWRFATGREKLEVGQAISFWMARPGALDLWTYDVVGRGMLQTARLGAVEAFHLKPRPIANPRGNITAEMWFAPSLQYLPVRIRVNMGEESFVDLLVEQIEQK